MFDDVLERAKQANEFLCALLANAFHARHVVGCVTHKREIIHHEFRSDTQTIRSIFHSHPTFFHAGGSAASGVQQPYARTHQLLKILVTRNNDHVVTGSHSFRSQCADDIVSFPTRH